MRIESLNYLGCCICNASLELKHGSVRADKLTNGTLQCSSCGLTFPVVQGRPVIMTDEMLRIWKSPVDEALGIERPGTLFDSVDTLLRMGMIKALSRAEEVAERTAPSGGSIEGISRSVLGKMMYRGSGKWFHQGNRKKRLLTFPWQSEKGDDSFGDFMNAVEMTEPAVLLDAASGGGFGVSQQAFLNRTARKIIAVERDLKCLNNIQYRFRYTGRSEVGEAVGGDVRHLPIQSGVVDSAMMLQSLPEIHGISRMLKEVHRVLKQSGSFIVLATELPFHTEKLPPADYALFAKRADLYAGYEHFQREAEKAGFRLISSRRYGTEGSFRRLIVMEKPPLFQGRPG